MCRSNLWGEGEDVREEEEALIPLGSRPVKSRGLSKRSIFLRLVLVLPPVLWLSMVFPGKYLNWRGTKLAVGAIAPPLASDSEFRSFCDALRYTVCFSVRLPWPQYQPRNKLLLHHSGHWASGNAPMITLLPTDDAHVLGMALLMLLRPGQPRRAFLLGSKRPPDMQAFHGR